MSKLCLFLKLRILGEPKAKIAMPVFYGKYPFGLNEIPFMNYFQNRNLSNDNLNQSRC